MLKISLIKSRNCVCKTFGYNECTLYNIVKQRLLALYIYDSITNNHLASDQFKTGEHNINTQKVFLQEAANFSTVY